MQPTPLTISKNENSSTMIKNRLYHNHNKQKDINRIRSRFNQAVDRVATPILQDYHRRMDQIIATLQSKTKTL